MKRNYIFVRILLIVLAATILPSCNMQTQCGYSEGRTKDFVDTFKIKTPFDSVFLFLGPPSLISATYEIKISNTLIDSILMTANIHGSQLSTDSLRSQKTIRWNHDTLSAFFDYQTLSVISKKNLTSVHAKNEQDSVLCAVTPNNVFEIDNVVIEIPSDKTLTMIENFVWKKK